MKRLAAPSEVAAAVTFLASDAKAFTLAGALSANDGIYALTVGLGFYNKDA